MALISVAQYRVATGDSTSASGTVDAALTTAQALLEEWLGRDLVSAERTETLQIDPNRRVFPTVTPITAAQAGWEIKRGGRYLESSFVVGSFLNTSGGIGVTYTGGYTADTLPETLRQAIAWQAWTLTHLDSEVTSVPAGATSVQVGDVRVDYGSATGSGNAAGGVLSARAKVLARRYRRRSP